MRLRDKLSNASNEIVKHTLIGIEKLPGVQPGPDEIRAMLRSLQREIGYVPANPEALLRAPVDKLDIVADRHINYYALVASSTGLAGGAAGLIGLGASIAGLLSCTTALAYRLSFIYGYEQFLQPGSENLVLLGWGAALGVDLLAAPAAARAGVGVAARQIMHSPAATKAAYQVVGRAIAKKGLDKVYSPVFIEKVIAPHFVREILKENALKFAGRMLPIAGMGIGAVSNGASLKIWGSRMKTYYRDRHLANREQIDVV